MKIWGSECHYPSAWHAPGCPCLSLPTGAGCRGRLTMSPLAPRLLTLTTGVQCLFRGFPTEPLLSSRRLLSNLPPGIPPVMRGKGSIGTDRPPLRGESPCRPRRAAALPGLTARAAVCGGPSSTEAGERAAGPPGRQGDRGCLPAADVPPRVAGAQPWPVLPSDETGEIQLGPRPLGALGTCPARPAQQGHHPGTVRSTASRGPACLPLRTRGSLSVRGKRRATSRQQAAGEPVGEPAGARASDCLRVEEAPGSQWDRKRMEPLAPAGPVTAGHGDEGPRRDNCTHLTSTGDSDRFWGGRNNSFKTVALSVCLPAGGPPLPPPPVSVVGPLLPVPVVGPVSRGSGRLTFSP